ncbi:MAG: ComF family protein, partial [Eubacterium sp.]|nr:ComF family protein [Eubacterium sp.]
EYKAVIAPFYYEGSVSRAILNMKMNEMPKLIHFQGKCVAEAVKKHYEEIDFDFVTFVPMRKSDKAKRGYNQAELLAEIVSKECNIPLKDVLVKKRKTKMQKRQKAKERFANMYNAFDVYENADVLNKRILLIDDVKTTGATLTSIALTLKAYGAASVYCAAIAIVK